MTASTSGSACGWTVCESPPNGWFWSAFGPNGVAQGITASKARAEMLARAEADNLKRPRSSEA